MVDHLAFGEEQHDGAALTIADGIELGVQAAFGSHDTSGSEAEKTMIRGIIGSLSPPFKQAGRCPVSLEVGRIDHDPVRLSRPARELGKDAVEPTQAAV